MTAEIPPEWAAWLTHNQNALRIEPALSPPSLLEELSPSLLEDLFLSLLEDLSPSLLEDLLLHIDVCPVQDNKGTSDCCSSLFPQKCPRFNTASLNFQTLSEEDFEHQTQNSNVKQTIPTKYHLVWTCERMPWCREGRRDKFWPMPVEMQVKVTKSCTPEVFTSAT